MMTAKTKVRTRVGALVVLQLIMSALPQMACIAVDKNDAARLKANQTPSTANPRQVIERDGRRYEVDPATGETREYDAK